MRRRRLRPHPVDQRAGAGARQDRSRAGSSAATGAAEIPDQIGILKTLTKWTTRIEKPQDAPALVAEAFQTMTSGRPRPVGLEIAPDILQARADIDPAAPLPQLAQPLDEDAIERAAKLLEQAERPLIFVGGGALDAAREVRALAERLGAPVATYRRGKGVMDERHPLAQVLTGGHALWATADVVLAVGPRLQWPPAVWGTTTRSRSSRSTPTRRDRAHREAEIGLSETPRPCWRGSTIICAICRPSVPTASRRAAP